LAGSTPLEQWRKAGRWPASYDKLWQELIRRRGKQPGTREMIELLQEGKRHGWPRFQEVVEQALAWGCCDPAAVRCLLSSAGLEREQPPKLVVEQLARFDRALPTMTAYDQLLVAGAAR
jgi:hypothetical protein